MFSFCDPWGHLFLAREIFGICLFATSPVTNSEILMRLTKSILTASALALVAANPAISLAAHRPLKGAQS